MKRRAVRIDVTDHALVRYLERAGGLDLQPLRDHIAGLVRNAAELEAAAVVVEGVRFVLRERAGPSPVQVAVSTTLSRQQRRGLGVDDGRHRAGPNEADDG